MKPPIYDMLMKYVSKQRIKFTTPAHKGKIRMKTDNLCSIDVESLPFLSGENNPSYAVKKSEEEIAGIFGASKSFYLCAGADAGIYASLSSICNPGDKVIVDPECDKAVINAITILALVPVFLKRSYCEKYSLNGGISTEKMEAAIESASDAKMIIVTSPTYYGVCTNIKKLTSLAHENNMLVMVDESYGAHFNFAKMSPQSALECGADIVVQSLSKTLGGFSGSGLLHLAESIDKVTVATIEANLDIYGGGAISTALLCASENILFYAFKNSDKYNIIYKEIERGRQLISAKSDILWFDVENGNTCDIRQNDVTKIVLNFSKVNMTAYEAAQMLISKYGIECDYADEDNIVFSVSLYNTATEIRKLVNSILVISKMVQAVDDEELEVYVPELFDEGPNAVMSPYKAFYCGGQWVDKDAAIGKICRKSISKMPHGTPIIIPGEKITSEQINTIKVLTECGVRIHGLNDNGQIEVLSLSDSFYF